MKTLGSCFYKLALTFLTCLFISTSYAQHNPLLGADNSFVNITKKNTGGFIQFGDTLEIRTTYFFGGSYNGGYIYKVRYYDSIPSNTALCTGGPNDYLRLITNESVVMRNYTQAANDDQATYIASPGAGDYQIRFNLGATAGATGASAGSLTNTTGASDVHIGTYKPKLFGGSLITTSFRVRVTGSAGDSITVGAAKFIYKKTSSGADTMITLSPYKILISPAGAPTLCGNSLGANLAGEYNGTFDNGTILNRAALPYFLIPSYDYLGNVSRTKSVYDGSYAVVNNSSPISSTSISARYQPNCSTSPIPVADSCVNRMHSGFWEIIGDHTGTNSAAGNPPAAAGSKGGYMLMVNADVITSEAYRHYVSGLCPNTYYEFSAWIRNICKKCAIDTNSTNTYKPGVKPNITFAINGLDIYSSGEIDTVGWVKKGFIFKTGSGQTSATFSIRNNAPGGGGNDWVLDDLSIGTCGPTTKINYAPVFLGCNHGTLASLSDTVKYSYNPDYSWYKWQRSTDGGLTWGDPPVAMTGSAVPVLTNGYYQYITNYPSFIATGADSGHLYRVIVANSFSNLSNSACLHTDGTFTFMKMIDCGMILDANFLSFNGKLQANNTAVLSWTVSSEKNTDKYEIERSSDGIYFTPIGEIKSRNSSHTESYSFNDVDGIAVNMYYRLRMVNADGLFQYSKVILLSRSYSFQVGSIVNPFASFINADIIMPQDGLVTMVLIDSYGKKVFTENRKYYKGLNKAIYQGFQKLGSGSYFVLFDYNGIRVQKKLSKIN